jgi:hypothetical protein
MAKRKKPHPTMVRLDAELYERVESLAKADRRPVATYLNRRCDRCSVEPRGGSRMTDAFADAFALLAAAADVKGFEARISRLKKLSEQVAADQVQLVADRAAAAADRAAADEREKALRVREAKVILAERALAAGQQQLAADRRAMAPKFAFDSNFGPGSMGPGGITRDEYRS